MSDPMGWVTEQRARWDTRGERRHLRLVREQEATGELPPATATKVAQREVSEEAWQRLYDGAFTRRFRTAVSKALAPARRARTALAKLPSVRHASLYRQQIEDRIDGAVQRELALLDKRFPPALRLVTDAEPFDYGKLWDECLAAVA